MRIGLDFDNTIVCYNEAIVILAEKLFELPPDLLRTKLSVRNFLRATGREPEWSAFQGELYGPGMDHAQPFEGAIATMQDLVAMGHDLVIISHRSRRPYAGEPHDLHLAARNWVTNRLQCEGLFERMGEKSAVHFLETLEQKVAMVAELNCAVFLDDLPEVLAARGFPIDTYPILFTPSREGELPKQGNNDAISAWCELPQLISALAV
jgi:hypothetical protein